MLEDLQTDGADSASKRSTNNLTLFKVDRYFHGPMQHEQPSKYRSSEDMLHAAKALVREVMCVIQQL